MELRVDRFGNPILDQFSEEGFVDCVFKIHDLRREARHFVFRMQATHQGDAVGCEVRMVRDIRAGWDTQMQLIPEHAYAEGVCFTRTGAESDRLLISLAELYGVGRSPTRMRDSEAFTAIALHQGEFDVEKDAVKLKLFGRDKECDPVEYNESFFNVDLANGFIFWNEKDPEYRDPLIRTLAGDAA